MLLGLQWAINGHAMLLEEFWRVAWTRCSNWWIYIHGFLLMTTWIFHSVRSRNVWIIKVILEVPLLQSSISSAVLFLYANCCLQETCTEGLKNPLTSYDIILLSMEAYSMHPCTCQIPSASNSARCTKFWFSYIWTSRQPSFTSTQTCPPTSLQQGSHHTLISSWNSQYFWSKIWRQQSSN